MATIRTRVTVREDGTIEGNVSGQLPPGEHEVVITTAADEQQPTPQFRWEDFPKHEGDWDHTVSLRREDLYGDDGR